MQINAADLKILIQRLSDNIGENLPDNIDIDAEDFYWEIPENDLYNPMEEPSTFTLGQLSDDWEELQRLKEGEVIPVSHDLKRLSAILQIISKKSHGTW